MSDLANDHQLDIEAARRQRSAPSREEDALREIERLKGENRTLKMQVASLETRLELIGKHILKHLR